MIPLFSRCRLFVGGLVVVGALVPALNSAFPAEQDKESPAGVEKIRKALSQTVDLELADMSLREAIAKIHEQTEMNIVVDEPGVAEVLDSPTKMTKLRKVRLRSGLQILLGPYHLAFVIVGDVLLITPKEHAADRQLQQLVNIDLNNVPLATALHKLARETATNLVIDPRVGKEPQATPLTMQLEEVPLEMAVRVMAEAAALKPARIGNVLFVTTEVQANELEADPSTKSPAQLQKLLNDGEGDYMLVPDEQKGGTRLVPRTRTAVGLGGLGLGGPGCAGRPQAKAEQGIGHRP